jgi:hypothetical protein
MKVNDELEGSSRDVALLLNFVERTEENHRAISHDS